jgi:hypothetical protein
MTKLFFAIDPDLHKSGTALYNSETKKLLSCECVYLWDLFIMLDKMVNITIFLEAGHLDKRCWHGGGRGGSSNVGKGKAIGVLLQEFMDKKGIKYKLLKPDGYSNFFKDEKFFKTQTGWQGRTNSDSRAAASMVWNRI